MTRRRERAQGLVELALVVPALLIVLVVVLGVGLVARADGGVGAVASEAAHAGALAGDAAGAVQAARSRAAAVAEGYGLTNGSLRVQVDTADFRRDGEVRVAVAYTLPLDRLPLLGWAAVPLRHEAAEPVAPHRSFRP